MVMKLITDDPDPQHVKQAVIIDEDRYGGSYSGFVFTAWFNEVPDDVSGSDSVCHNYWFSNNVVFGGGNTPDDAAADLLKKLYQDNIQLERDGKTVVGYTVYVETIWNTSQYSGRCPVEQRVIWTKEDRRFEELYPKTAIIFRQCWGE